MSRPNLFKCAPEWAQWAAVQSSGYVVFSDKPMVLNTKLGQWTPIDGAQWLEQEYHVVDPSGWMFSRTPRDSAPETQSDEQVYWIVLDSDGNRVGSKNGTLTVCKSQNGGLLAARGCFSGTLDEFEARVKKKSTWQIQKEYALLIEFARLRLGSAS